MWSYISRFLYLFCMLSAAFAAKKKETVQKVDLPGIACDVCEMVIGNLHTEVKEMRKDAPYNKLEELEIQQVMENSCNPEAESGEWIRHVDIATIEKNGKFYAVAQDQEDISKCEAECLTVARSCDSLFEDEMDPDDLSAILYKNKHSLERLTVLLFYHNIFALVQK